MRHQDIYYPEVNFGGFTAVDGTIAFFLRINALLQPSFTVLDIGCGRGEYMDDAVETRRNLRILKGKVAKVVGIDVDENARANPFIDEFHLLRGPVWPIENDTVDLIVCNYVLEHIEEPDLVFAEARRVLKNGGYFCIRTPNKWNYVSLMARIIPDRYHAKVTTAVQDTRKEEDVFPTVYRCNTVGQIRKKMKDFGFKGVVFGYEAEPSYLSFSRFAYWLGVMHQRLAPGFLKHGLFAFGRLKKNDL